MNFFLTCILAVLPSALAVDNRRHFYTTDPNGENAKAAGYSALGGAGNALTSQVSGTVPMYRCYNGPQDLHFYTTSSNCEGASGYRVEGVGWYCFPNNVDQTIPLNRYTQQNGDHWYVMRGYESASQGDREYYSYEGVACFVYEHAINGAVPITGWARGTVY